MKINFILDTNKVNPNSGLCCVKVIIDDEIEDSVTLLPNKDTVKLMEVINELVRQMVQIHLYRKQSSYTSEMRKVVNLYKECVE